MIDNQTFTFSPINSRTSINETTFPEGGKDGIPIYVPPKAL